MSKIAKTSRTAAAPPVMRSGSVSHPMLLPAGGRAASMHAVFHRTCGHTVLAGPDRASLVSMIGNLKGSGRFALRIRIATRDDLVSVTRGITCNLCRGLA